MDVAVLFARSDSIYKDMDGVDVFDAERDARTWQGGCPLVAHPPCRAWGRLRSFANPRPDEKNLARLAVALVREFGGVLEHPAGSTLWPSQKLPPPENVISGVDGPWQHRKSGGDTRLKKHLGFISWVASLRKFQMFHLSLVTQLMWCRPENAMTTGHISQNQSVSTHQWRWVCGLLSWLDGATLGALLPQSLRNAVRRLAVVRQKAF